MQTLEEEKGRKAEVEYILNCYNYFKDVHVESLDLSLCSMYVYRYMWNSYVTHVLNSLEAQEGFPQKLNII